MFVAFLLLLLSQLWGAAVRSEYLTKGSALNEPYTLLSTHERSLHETLGSPVKVYSADGLLEITMTVETTSVTVTDLFSYQSRVYCLNGICQAPGPSIFVRAGDEVKITLVNKLETGTANTTNMYVRGLHLERTHSESPSGVVSIHNPYPANSLRGIKGSEDGDNSATYTFTIPEDHAPGMHWYHSNVADDTYGDTGGSTAGTAALHMMNGLVGAFHVLPEDDQVLPERLQAMNTIELILTHVMVGQNSRDVTQLSAIEIAADTSFTRAWTLAELEAGAGGGLGADVTFHSGSAYTSAADNYTTTRDIRDVWLANGQYQPEIALQPGEWTVFNILAASGDRHLELEVRDAIGPEAGNRACELWLYAMDGVYLESPRYADNTNHLVLLPGSRASVGVHCPAAGTYYLQSASSSNVSSLYSSVGTYDTKSAQLLATINVTGTLIWDQQGGMNVSLANISRPAYLASLMASAADAASWSVAVDSAGADGSAAGSAHLGGRLGLFQQLGDDTASYWAGTGPDCTVPCFTNRDCAALFGSNYTVADFYPVSRGHCAFGRGRASISAEAEYPAANINTPFSYTKDSAVDIRVWGRYPRAYPLSLSSGHVQIVDYTAATVGPAANSVYMARTTATYTSSTNYTVLSLYGEAGDWRDTVPALPGLLTVRTRLHLPPQQPAELIGTHGAKAALHCNYLKFEDHGLIERFLVDSSNATYSSPVTTTITAGGDSGTNASTSTRSGVVYDSSANSTAFSAGAGFADKDTFDTLLRSPSPMNLDAADASTSCDTFGDSWAYRETVDTARQVRVITFNGCPNHYSVCQEASCGGNASRAVLHPDVITVPLYPSFRTVRRDATCTREPVGVALNGVPIHGKADSAGTATCTHKKGVNETIAPHDVFTACDLRGNGAVHDGALYCGDEVPQAAPIMDKCAGYADAYGSYRYLVAPACLLNQLAELRAARESAAGGTPTDTFSASGTSLYAYNGSVLPLAAGATAASASPQVGWALDGFPIYGPVGTAGIAMLRCGQPGAHATVCLDVCNGYKGITEEDNFNYRYYMAGERGSGACSNYTANANPSTYAYTGCPRLEGKCCLSSAPNPSAAPYSVGCFMGCKYNETGCRLTGERGVRPSYMPAADMPTVPAAVYLASPQEEGGGEISGGGDAASSAAVGASGTTTTTLTAVQSQQQALEALYLAQQTAQAKRNFTRPKNVVQLPFSHALALVETPLASVNLTNSATTDDSVTVETLAAADTDLVINNIVVDPDLGSGASNLVYIASGSGVFEMTEGKGGPYKLVAGYLKIEIAGLNFGSSQASVESLTIQGHECDSVVWFSSTRVTCVLSREGTTSAASYTEEDVVLSIAGAGTANGVYLEPMTVFKSGSGRPAISAVTFTERPFRPMSVAYLSRRVPTLEQTVKGTTSSTTSTRTYDCGMYYANNTLDNRQNYTNCEILACGGDMVTASLCESVGATCNGDTMLTLHNELYPICDGIHNCPEYTHNHSVVAENNDYCGACARLFYKVPVSDNDPSQCSPLYLRQGCNANVGCSGNTIVSVEHTEWNLAANLTADDYENGTRRVLYWSDSAQGGYGIFRCRMSVSTDGTPHWCSQPELVISGVQRARGLQAIPVSCSIAADGSLSVEEEGTATNQCDLLVYADSSTGGLYRTLLPAMVVGTVYDADPAASMYGATAAGIGGSSSVEIASGLRGPVSVYIDGAYFSSSVNERAGARLFLSLLEGKLLRFDMSLILGPSSGLPLAFRPNSFRYDDYDALGVITVLDSPSKARFGGLCAVPALSVSDGATNVVSWKQHRVFVVDSNQNYVYATTEWKSGARPDITLDVNAAYDTPSAILMPVSISTKISGNSATSVELYIAEYLGKIWKITVALDTTSGEVDLTDFAQNAPSIVLDMSTFTSSIRIREEAELAKSAGNPIYERVFFDALQ